MIATDSDKTFRNIDAPWQKEWLCHHGQKEGSGTQTERQNEDIACDEKKSTFSFRARKVDTFHSVLHRYFK